MQIHTLMPGLFGSLTAYLRGMCLMLFLIVSFDWGQAGDIRVNNVNFYNAKSTTPSVASLPYLMDSAGRNGYYELEFLLSPGILEHIFPLRVIAQDCISSIETAGVVHDMRIISTGNPCDSEQGIALNRPFIKAFSGHLLNIQVRDLYVQQVGLKLARGTFFHLTSVLRWQCWRFVC